MKRKVIREDAVKISELLLKVGETGIYDNVERMGGLTNRTYKVFVGEKEYAVRIPGEGTEEIIDRGDEKISTELACKLGIDAELLYFGADGSKVTRCILNAVTMSANTLKESKNIKQVAAVFKKLHSSKIDTHVPFEVFEMAAGYEKIINKNNIDMYKDYLVVKSNVMRIKSEVDALIKIKKVPCHNDPLCENWILEKGDCVGERMYLIDWEYAGMNDGMWDLADVSIEADYEHYHDELLLSEYLGCELNEKIWKHFLANKIYVDYLWTLWAKMRVPYDGLSMEVWAEERYTRLKKYIEEFTEMEG